MNITKYFSPKLKSYFIIFFFKAKRNVALKLGFFPVLSAASTLVLDAQELHNTHGIPSTMLILLRDVTALIAILLFVFYLFSYLIIVSIRKSGLNKSYLGLIKKGDIASLTLNRFISANDREKGVYFLDKPQRDVSDFQFAASDELAKISGELNFEAFKNSPWQDSKKDKIDRNISHTRKNNMCILLLKNKNEDYIGFTHIIPVNQEAWNEYLGGHLSDNDFSCENIVPTEKEFDDDKAVGVIIFSIALLGDADQISAPDRLQFVFEAIHYHLYELVEKEFKRNRRMNILVQTGDDKLARLCRNSGMKKYQTLSKDNCPMYLGKIRVR